MKYFYDTEFLDTGKEIIPISIGIVAEDGREFYAVWNNAMETCRKDSWLMENVALSLPLDPADNRFLDKNNPQVMNSVSIARSVYDFLSFENNTVELWAWFAAYDHVVLSQLWGKMISVPRPIPQRTNDIAQLACWYGITRLPSQKKGIHNALEDARHNKVVFDYIHELLES